MHHEHVCRERLQIVHTRARARAVRVHMRACACMHVRRIRTIKDLSLQCRRMALAAKILESQRARTFTVQRHCGEFFSVLAMCTLRFH